MNADDNNLSVGVRVDVARLTEDDLDSADAVLRSAFDAFVGVRGRFRDADYVHGRFRAAPDAALKAELDGDVVGSNFVTRWGSFGFFGPLSVRLTCGTRASLGVYWTRRSSCLMRGA